MSSETNVYQMKGNNMSNIHKKLYNACNHASGVKKASHPFIHPSSVVLGLVLGLALV